MPHADTELATQASRHLDDTARPRGRFESSTEDGFVLVTVIWIVALLAVAAFIATTAARSRLSTVRTDISAAEAMAAADTGIALALQELLDRRSQPSQLTNQLALPLATPACRLNDTAAVFMSLHDEAARIDVNFASSELLRAVMIGLGWSERQAIDRAAALKDFIDRDDDARNGGSESALYQAAARSTGPKNAALKAVEEIGQVLGFDQSAVRDLLPHITVHSGLPGIDPTATSPELAALVASGARGQRAEPSLEASTTAFIPPEFRSTSSNTALTIVAHSATRSGAHFVREAVITIKPAAPPQRPSRQPAARAEADFRVLRWRRAATVNPRERFSLHAELPSC